MNYLFAMLPCYNEELNIGELIEEWVNQKSNLNRLGYQLQVCAIDDCSTDNTKSVIQKKCEKYPDDVILLSHRVNLNLCGGLNTSINYFLKHGNKGDFMCLMDGDNTHNPKYVIEMINRIKNNVECVIASRYCGNADVVGVAKHREFMSDMAKHYYSFMLKVPNVKDYTCGYRVYTFTAIQRLVEKYGNEPIKEKTFACMMELLYKLYLTGTSFDEVGFELRYDNKKGESKMRVIKTMRKSVSTAYKLRRNAKKG